MSVSHNFRPESSLSCELDLFRTDEQNGLDTKVLQTFKCHPGLVQADTLPGKRSLAEELKTNPISALTPSYTLS